MTPSTDISSAGNGSQDAHLAFARRMDRIDGLGHYRRQFVGIEPDSATGGATGGISPHAAPNPVAYLDGNSLGRPLRASVARITEFLTHDWGTRLIRGWDEAWLDLPLKIGDDIGRAALGAGPGQVFVGDSTTVLLYKLARAAVDYLRVDTEPMRTEIVLDTDNFPTDRYLLEGIAAERGMTLRWIHSDPVSGVTVEQVRQAVGPQTALVLLSHVAYRSGFLADMREITAVVHAAGGLVLWDLSHSVGSVVVELDLCDVDLAVGCSYKYLNGGPGAPAFAYVRRDLQDVLTQPIQGWMGTKDVFMMGPGYVPADGIRRFMSGTPPIVGMLAMQDAIAMIEEAGIDQVRAKSVALTEFALTLVDAWLAPMGVTVSSPREPTHRGGHLTVNHPAMRQVTQILWEHDVIPDFRGPDALRIGLSPLSTSFVETFEGVAAIRDVLRGVLLGQSGLAGNGAGLGNGMGAGVAGALGGLGVGL